MNDPHPKTRRRKMTVPAFMAARQQGRRITMLTAYDSPWARMFDEAGIDAILVGDTLGMVVQGKSTTLPVTLDEMIYHGELVARAVRYALVIVDMPFLSFQVSPHDAVANAGRILKETGADAVKLEGGAAQAETINALATADIPVLAHLGMKPQSVRRLGGMGKIQRDEDRLLSDARAAQDAGAFGIVLELIPQSVAEKVTQALSIPTIGIGAGPKCDGQVLVSHDMLGITDDFQPKFLKRYSNLREQVMAATKNYIGEVREGLFPDSDHSHD